jgi:hypothetical protein
MDWPTQSPNLNPIEQVWVIFKRCLNLYSTHLKNLYKLWNHVQEVYTITSIEECQRIYASMHAQITIVLEAKKGGQFFEWFVDVAQKTESIYIPNFKMVNLAIFKFLFSFNLYVLHYFVLYNFCM